MRLGNSSFITADINQQELLMKTVLIVRLSAIGDIVMASPVAAALKASDHNTRVIWLTQPESASLVQHNPLIDEVIIWPRAEWQSLWRKRQYRMLFRTINAFRQILKSKAIDIAIDLQGLLKSGILTAMSGATEKIGLGSKEGSQWLMNQVIARDCGDTDLIGSEYRWLCQQLQLGEQPWQMSVGASNQAIENVAQLHKDTLRKPYIVICPFTTRPQKHWHNAGWCALIPKLAALTDTHVDDANIDNNQVDIVLLGGPADTENANKLDNNPSVINLVGKTSLTEAALIIKAATALVGVDTGLTHMGHAFNIPTVALFGSTKPYLKTDSDNGSIIYLDKHCSPCKRKPTCNGRFDCLNDISPDYVISQLNGLLDNQPVCIQAPAS